MRVSELSGVDLDYWVAKALGHDPMIVDGVCEIIDRVSASLSVGV